MGNSQIITTPAPRAAIYIRYSSENQRDGFSIEYQSDECRKYIAEQGFTFIKEYIDEAVSGKSTANRAAFFELLADVKSGLYDVVIVYKYSRFARNLMEATLYRQQIEKAGAKLVSAMERIDDSTPEGRMMRNIIMTMDEYYSDNLSTFVLSSMYTAAKSGKFLGGRFPYGYTVDENGRFVADEKEAAIVRRVFDLRASGMNPADIVRTLHADGIRARSGKRFTGSFVAKMLKNERYIGTYKYEVSGYEPIIIPGAIEPLISAEKWDAVQEILKKESRAPYIKARMRHRVYPLVGKMYCGQCGEPFRGNGRRLKNKDTGEYDRERVYYTCRGQHVHNVCDVGSIRKDQIEPFVFGKIRELILNEKFVDEIAKIVHDMISQGGENAAEEIAELRKEKMQAEKRLESLLDLYVDGKITKEILDKKSAALQAELVDVSARLQTKEYAEKNKFSLAKTKEFLLDMIEKLDASDDTVKKAIAEQFVKKITVGKTDVSVELMVNPSFVTDNSVSGGALYSLSVTRTESTQGKESRINFL